jgi:hypothetical protein
VSVGTEGGAPDSAQLSPGEYDELIGAIRGVVHRVVPSDATVLVVSRGDDELLALGPRRAMHFPQDEDGRYAGYHPADSDEAIALLEKTRAGGADFLLFPSVTFWWLDYYDGFKQYIEHRYRLVEAGEHCWIAALSEDAHGTAAKRYMAQPSTSPLAEQMGELLGSLLPEDARTAILAVAGQDSIELDGYETWLVPGNSEGLRDALARLERSAVRFVVVPKTLFGWMEDQPEPAHDLQERHRIVTRQAHLCEVYELHRATAGTEERNGSARSFGERLKSLIFRRRRNDRRS